MNNINLVLSKEKIYQIKEVLKSCDVLVMSATPIPLTMIMTVFGDMDVSIIKEKPKNRKDIKTYSKVENNINDVIKFVKKEVGKNNQVFWVCPLIEESKKLIIFHL